MDLTTEVLRLKEKGAEYIFMQILPDKIYVALKAADKINYDVPFIGTWTSTDPDFFILGKGLIRNRVAMQFCGVLPQDKTPRRENDGDRFYRNCGQSIRLWISSKLLTGKVWSIAMIMERAMHRASRIIWEDQFGNDQ